MRTQQPVFLFAFANDEGGSLQLSEEERSLRHVMAPAHDQGRIETIPLGHTTIDDLYRAFNRFHNRIAVFHYGGHSDAAFLQLEGGNARTSALSTLIGQQGGLKLVFLNGCANRAQVELLFAKGVKAVIATSCPIGDERAVLFSESFYQALAAGKSIRESFDTARSRLEHGESPPPFAAQRAANWTEVPNGEFPWGLYAQEEADLAWSLPLPLSTKEEQDYTQEVELQLPDVNKGLVTSLFRGMAKYNPAYKALYDLYEASPTSTHFNILQNTLLDALPSMLSIQIRDLFTPEGRSKGRVRLRELDEAYGTLARLLCAIAVANLWEEAHSAAKDRPLLIQEGYRKDLESYIYWSPLGASPKDYLWILSTVGQIFADNKIEPYMTELTELNTQFREANAVYDAYRFLEQDLSRRLMMNKVSTPEVESLCQQAEEQLAILLEACAFLCNYQLVAIKDISVDKPRKKINPEFIHQKAVLKGRDYATIDTDPLRRESTANNNAIFLTRSLEKDGLPLNLSPFLIDQNAFKLRKHHLPKLYFFAGFADKKLYFAHADTIDLDFIVAREEPSDAFGNLDLLFTNVAEFQQDIGLPLVA
jgi:hypothetical protein